MENVKYYSYYCCQAERLETLAVTGDLVWVKALRLALRKIQEIENQLVGVGT